MLNALIDDDDATAMTVKKNNVISMTTSKQFMMKMTIATMKIMTKKKPMTINIQTQQWKIQKSQIQFNWKWKTIWTMQCVNLTM